MLKLFDRSFELSLEERNPAVLGLDCARDHGMANEFKDVMPTTLYAEASPARA